MELYNVTSEQSVKGYILLQAHNSTTTITYSFFLLSLSLLY